jgi:hypothetical protein
MDEDPKSDCEKGDIVFLSDFRRLTGRFTGISCEAGCSTAGYAVSKPFEGNKGSEDNGSSFSGWGISAITPLTAPCESLGISQSD